VQAAHIQDSSSGRRRDRLSGHVLGFLRLGDECLPARRVLSAESSASRLTLLVVQCLCPWVWVPESPVLEPRFIIAIMTPIMAMQPTA
jgi:hypothetical protein